MTKMTGKSLLFITAAFSFILSGCLSMETRVVQWYKSSKIASYNINSVVLLPLEKDDSTNTGTFYSTNYFLKSLKDNFPQNKFEVLDISRALQNDSTIVKRVIETIEQNRAADLKIFNSTGIGDSLNLKKADAIILGRINNPCNSLHLWQEPEFVIMSSWQTGCNFTYYMVSLKDGKVLWMGNVFGSAEYQEDLRDCALSDWDLYPPLDNAISNGIDKIIHTIPLGKNGTNKF